MTTMEHKIVHGLPIAAATALLREAVDDYTRRFAKYSPVVTWNSEHDAAITFTARGLHLEGALRVDAAALHVRLEVPFMLRPFAKQAMVLIDAEVRRWIEKAQRELA